MLDCDQHGLSLPDEEQHMCLPPPCTRDMECAPIRAVPLPLFLCCFCRRQRQVVRQAQLDRLPLLPGTLEHKLVLVDPRWREPRQALQQLPQRRGVRRRRGAGGSALQRHHAADAVIGSPWCRRRRRPPPRRLSSSDPAVVCLSPQLGTQLPTAHQTIARPVQAVRAVVSGG